MRASQPEVLIQQTSEVKNHRNYPDPTHVSTQFGSQRHSDLFILRLVVLPAIPLLKPALEFEPTQLHDAAAECPESSHL